MKSPDEIKRTLIQSWYSIAEEDYEVAQHLASHKTPYLMAIGFHAQQAVEKYLKALLVSYQIEFPKTHDIGVLLNLIGKINAPLADSLGEARTLTPLGVEVRYPDDISDLQPINVSQVLEVVKSVRNAVMEVLN